MLPDSLARAVQDLPAPWSGHYFELVDSTQDEARAAARLGAPHRSVFVADAQRVGRGRRGRSWQAEAGSALLMSLVFRDWRSSQPWRYTSLASVALAQTIPGAAIKWPNDLMLGDDKLAGILAETTWDGSELVAIVGIGVNVSTAPREVPHATFLGNSVDRGELLISFLRNIDRVSQYSPEALHREWQSRLWRRNQRVHLVDRDIDEDVIVVGANQDGSLRVRTSDGTERVSMTGELLA